MKTKTVNLSGKKIEEKALVVKAKKIEKIENVEDVKKLNEKIKAKKITNNQKTSAPNKDQETDSKKQTEDRTEKKKYELSVGMKDLLAAGCHLGHKVSKTYPKARENIYGSRDGIEIFDLAKTEAALQRACDFIYNEIKSGKQIVMVGTKRQAREIVRRVATEAGVPYVTDRWLGGTITNWEQIRKDVRKLADLKDGLEKNRFVQNTKKEVLEIKKEVIRLEKIIGGLAGLDKMFDVLFLVDIGFEKTAVKEALIRGVKMVALVDSDSDPGKVDYAIPANDDSAKSVTILVEEVGKAIKAAKQ